MQTQVGAKEGRAADGGALSLKPEVTRTPLVGKRACLEEEVYPWMGASDRIPIVYMPMATYTQPTIHI